MADDGNHTQVTNRATDSHKGTRGIASRGLPKREPERDVKVGNLSEVVPGKLYKASGLDIGSTDFLKRGVGDGFDRVVDAYKRSPDSKIVITGSKSTSGHASKDEATLAKRRAESAKKVLISKGVPESAIQTESSPYSKVNTNLADDAQQKASMRGAMIEIIPPKRQTAPRKEFQDGITYIKGQPKEPSTWWPPPIFPRWLEKAQDKSMTMFASSLMFLIPFGSFLLELIEAAALEYGAEKVAKYVKEKLEPRLKKGNPRDGKDEKKFMDEMLKRILKGGIEKDKKHHKLWFLIDPKTMDWKTRIRRQEYAVQAGHVLSHSGGGFSFALEDAERNQDWRGRFIEARFGSIAFSLAVMIQDVPVDLVTAWEWEAQKHLSKGTVKKARYTVGWINF